MGSVSPAVQLGSTRRVTALPPDARFLAKLWHGWQRVARAFGVLLSRVVTTLVYFAAVTPFALVARLLTDPLEIRPRSARWTPLPPPGDLDEARRGF